MLAQVDMKTILTLAVLQGTRWGGNEKTKIEILVQLVQATLTRLLFPFLLAIGLSQTDSTSCRGRRQPSRDR